MADNENLTWKRRLAAPFLRGREQTLRKLAEIPSFLEFMAANSSCARFADKYALHGFVNAAHGAAGVDYLEFGVADGNTFLHWLAINLHPDSRFYGFDSFRGLPEDFVPGAPRGAFDRDGRPPTVSDARARFVVGPFQETLRPFVAEFQARRRLIVHCDADLYTSTLYVLTTLDRVLAPGSILVFDEFSALVHERRAYLDYIASYRRRATPIAATESFGQIAFQLE